MNPLAQLLKLQMSPQTEAPAPDYAMPGPAPDMQTAYAQLAAQQAIPQMPAARRPSTDSEIMEFVREMAKMRDALPDALKLKLDELMVTIEGGVPQNEAGWDLWEEEQADKDPRTFKWGR